jgi:uncharacterized membrane protein
MIVLSYLGPLALIPLLVEKNDREVQWHAKHGIVLMVAEFALAIALMIVSGVVVNIPGLGCIVAVIGLLFQFVLGLGILVLHVFAIIKGLNGQRLLIPGISEYANRF